MPRKIKVEARHRRVARRIVRDGMSVAGAMRAEGYAEKQCEKGFKVNILGKRCLNKAVRDELKKMSEGNMALPPPEQRANVARMRLFQNVLEGRDRAVGSTKLLGMDKEVNMFQPESQVGVIIVSAPPDAERLLRGLEEEQDKTD